MSIRNKYLATLLLFAGPVTAVAADVRCPGGDAWKVAMEAERALARAQWPLAARLHGCAALRGDDPALAERATRSSFENRQFVMAVASARRWLELAPDNEVARRHLATGLLRLYDDRAAGVEFAELLSRSYPDRARGFLVLLGILSDESNETGAARIMEGLAAANPAIAEAQYAASVLWQRAEDGTKSLAAARRALALQPGWRLAELAEVGALLTLGRTADALARSAELAASGDAQARLSHAWLLLGHDRRPEAVTLFGELRQAGGDATGDAIAGLAAIAIDEKRLDDAAALLREAGRDPDRADATRWSLGQIAELRQDQATAAREYQRVTAGPRAINAQLRAFRLWRQLGAPEYAEIQLNDFLSSSPSYTNDAVAGTALVLVDEGRSSEAVALLDRALALTPDDDLRLSRGYLLERLDRVDEAVADLRAVAASRPDDPVALNALGYTLVDRTRSIAEGQRLIERALAAKPDSYAVQDSMGWALVRLGRYEEGRGWLQTAWDRSEDPEIAAHLGETAWLMGRTDEAHRIWDEALADNPDSRPLKRAIERHPR